VVEKAGQTEAETPVRPQVYWQKVERQEILEIRVIRESFEDEKIKGRDNWSCNSVQHLAFRVFSIRELLLLSAVL